MFHKRYKYWQGLTGDFTTPPQCMPEQYKHKSYVAFGANVHTWLSMNNGEDFKV